MTALGFDLLVTAVSDRADLFGPSMESLLANVDAQPARIIVHEDVRPGTRAGEIGDWLAGAERAGRIREYVHGITHPARGMGPAMLWCFERAAERPDQPFAFYAQEDWLVLRPLQVRRALEVLERHGLHHVRWNKRTTLRGKRRDTDRPFVKVEVDFPMPDGAIERWTVSDHVYTQASLNRVEVLLPALRATAERCPDATHFVPAFNTWLNDTLGDGVRDQHDAAMRRECLKTYIVGPIGTPAFLQHLGAGPRSTKAQGPTDTSTARGGKEPSA